MCLDIKMATDKASKGNRYLSTNNQSISIQNFPSPPNMSDSLENT